MIKGFTPRLYQETILDTCTKKNTLVVLPTGLGKTNIFLMLAANRLKNYPDSKILLLGPTRPLIDQYYETFKKYFNIKEEDMAIFTGFVKPEKRAELWKKAKIIFSTPQGLENDVIAERIKLEEVSLLGFDEAHRAVGDYAYVFVAKQYHKKSKIEKIIGLTASPGSDLNKITEICQNLFIEDIEVRTDEDPDVKEYIQELDIKWIQVILPEEFKQIKKFLEDCVKDKLRMVKKFGYLSYEGISKKDLIALQAGLHGKIARGEKDFAILRSISLIAEALKVQHALELLESQGIAPLMKYLDDLQKQAETTKVKAVKNLVKDLNFRSAYIKAKRLEEQGIEHPKLGKLQEILSKIGKKTKVIVFNQYRDSAVKIAEEINKLDNIDAKMFFGQAKKKDTGLSQKEQKRVLDDFRVGKFNVLVATSVDPNEYIILKNPEGDIEIKKIGEFVDSFIKHKIKGNSASKKIKKWQVISTNDKKIDFYPITDVHKHKRQSKVVNVILNSGFKCLVTEDHSLFTFDNKGKTIATKPEENKFVSIANSVPNIEKVTKVNVIKELLANAPKDVLNKLFCSFRGTNQPKMRMYSTELKVLSKLNKRRFKTELSKLSKVDITTITNSTKRLEESGFIKSVSKGRYIFCEITVLGKEYLDFLKWFFRYHYYHKRKYRVSLNDVVKAPKTIHKFCDIRVGVWYGKATVPPFLELNEYLAELLGWYVAEGSARYTKDSSDIYLASRKRKIRKRMDKCIAKGLYLKPSITLSGVASNAQIAHHLIKYVFRCGVGTYNKEIPNIIFSAPTKQKLKFLEGYFLGDGNISKDRITFTTVSRKLATGLIFLLKQLGINNVTLRKDNCYRICVFESLPFAKMKNKKSNKTYYNTVPVALVSKKGFEKYANFYMNTQKKSGACRTIKKPEGAMCFDFIKKIEKIKKQPKFVYDISVRGTERFFGGFGLICLHNSVAEEGLDIPKVEEVIFYEPIPSAIRHIQRRGRTGRLEKGKVTILVTQETRDVGYRWSAYHKEKRMYRILEKLKTKFAMPEQKEVSLKKFIKDEENVKIYVDYREKGSGVIKELIDLGIKINLEKLEVGDYILSSDVAVEYKTIKDFVDSLIDGRLLAQVKALKKYEKPLLIVEGDEDIYSQRKVHPNAIRGMLASIVIDFNVPILYTKNFKDTAALLAVIAKREQIKQLKEVTLHTQKPLTLKEQQEYIISSLPGIGPTLSKPLLKKFKTVKKVINASEDKLKKIDLIGEKKAKRIKEVLEEDYI